MNSDEIGRVVVLVVAGLALFLGLWVGVSHMEAKAYKRVTGKEVTVWDAMWLQLRVQESAGD